VGKLKQTRGKNTQKIVQAMSTFKQPCLEPCRLISGQPRLFARRTTHAQPAATAFAVTRLTFGTFNFGTAPAALERWPRPKRTMNSRKHRVSLLLVDDHPVVRNGIRACLGKRDQFEVVGEAANGKEAVGKAKELSPDIVLMDLHMPQMDGLEATTRLRKAVPKVKVLILSVNNNRESILQTIRSGARGYVLKDAPPEELVQAIESVARGGTFFSSEVTRIVLNQQGAGNGNNGADRAHPLTERETQVLAMIADGQTNNEIAMRLGISVRTVEAHREHVMRKLNLHSVVGLTRFAIANRIIALR
jgi:two-component system nitrate/nitrite response regulator NarL